MQARCNQCVAGVKMNEHSHAIVLGGVGSGITGHVTVYQKHESASNAHQHAAAMQTWAAKWPADKLAQSKAAAATKKAVQATARTGAKPYSAEAASHYAGKANNVEAAKMHTAAARDHAIAKQSTAAPKTYDLDKMRTHSPTNITHTGRSGQTTSGRTPSMVKHGLAPNFGPSKGYGSKK